jgi:hypothetical protein
VIDEQHPGVVPVVAVRKLRQGIGGANADHHGLLEGTLQR